MKITLIFALFVSVSAHADWEALSASDFRMSPPPAEGSAAEKADFRKLHQYQEERTDEQCAQGASQTVPTARALFGGRNGVLSASELKEVKPLLSRVLNLSHKISSSFKAKFKRPRPYDVDETLEPCAKKPGGARAYPSSHAVMGAVGSCVLAEIFPDRAEEIVEHGQYVGELRVIVGVHHPSDVKAGQKLGAEICEELLSDRGFKRELAELE